MFSIWVEHAGNSAAGRNLPVVYNVEDIIILLAADVGEVEHIFPQLAVKLVDGFPDVGQVVGILLSGFVMEDVIGIVPRFGFSGIMRVPRRALGVAVEGCKRLCWIGIAGLMVVKEFAWV